MSLSGLISPKSSKRGNDRTDKDNRLDFDKCYDMYLKEIECNSKLIEEINAMDREIMNLKNQLREQENLTALWKQINKSKTRAMKKALFEGKMENPCGGCLHRKKSFEEIILDNRHCNLCDVPYIIFQTVNDIYKFRE